MAKITGKTQYNTSKFTFFLEATESNVDIAKNTSKVKVTAKLTLKDWGWIDTWNTYKGYIKIDGTEYSFGIVPDYPIKTGSKTYTLVSKEKTVTHGADGTKTCSISAQWNTVGPTYSPGKCTASGSLKLTAIPRNSNVSIANFDMTKNQVGTVKIDRKSSSFVHTLKVSANNVLIRQYTNVATSQALNFTDAEMVKIYEATPSSTTTKIKVECMTYLSGKAITGQWTSASCNCVFGSKGSLTIEPNFTQFQIADTNQLTNQLTGNLLPGATAVKLVRYASKPQITVAMADKATGKYNASIKHYMFYVGDKEAQKTYSSSADVTHVFDTMNTATCKVSAVDSRGKSKDGRSIPPIEFIPYTKPTIDTMSVERENGADIATTLKFEGSFFNEDFGTEVNIIDAKYRYKKSDQAESEYVEGGPLTLSIEENKISYNATINGDATQGHGFLSENSYHIQVEIRDRLFTFVKTIFLEKGIPIMHMTKNGIGINKLYSKGALDVQGDIFTSGKIEALGDVITSGTLSSLGNIRASGNIYQKGFKDDRSIGNNSGWYWSWNGFLIQWGGLYITPKADTPTKAAVKFTKAFTYTPQVVASTSTSVPGTTVLGAATDDITNSGFSAVVTRKNTTNTAFRWIAIGYAAR